MRTIRRVLPEEGKTFANPRFPAHVVLGRGFANPTLAGWDSDVPWQGRVTEVHVMD